MSLNVFFLMQVCTETDFGRNTKDSVCEQKQYMVKNYQCLKSDPNFHGQNEKYSEYSSLQNDYTKIQSSSKDGAKGLPLH